MPPRQALLAGAAALLAGAAAPASGALEARFEWRAVAEGGHGEGVAALAVDASGLRLALGDAGGVRLADAAGGFRRLLNRGPVRDLAFLPPGVAEGAALLAATDAGLYRVSERESAALAPAPGSEARSVHRIAVSPAAVALAADAGAFVSTDGRLWQRLSPQLPLAPASAVALREEAGRLECFAALEGRLWRVQLARGPQGLRPESARRETIPFAAEAEGPVDVVFGAGGESIVVVFPSSFAARRSDAEAWRTVELALPPGARARRLHAAHGLLWLATDRGLLVAEALAGPWERAAAPGASADVRALASDARAVYVAAGERVLAAQPLARARAGASGAPLAAASGSAGALRLRTPEGDPPIEHVHGAALAWLDLRPERVAGLRRGVARRGWLPVVSLRLARTRDEDESTDLDDVLTSGVRSQLVDRAHGRSSDAEAALTFSWDLGDLAFHPEAIDVSREAREVIKLRDDVLDEVTQLYFERRRVLAELAAEPDAPPEEKLRLQLRAAELAAGIDAWTGGWFGRTRAAAHP
jgi:hypothetical protein